MTDSGKEKSKKPRYGRGKFETHPNYVDYMHVIVSHPNFEGMPNAVSENGKINWQVSSGKQTSFYKHFLARKEWWINKADSLGVSGKRDESGRITTAARINHPTGYGVCMLCGELFNVGYFYLNANFTKTLNKAFPEQHFVKGEPINDVLEKIPSTSRGQYIREKFGERAEFFDQFGISKRAFEESNFVKSTKLTPGFMGNPDSRLDGFHDYCFTCRKKSDPGRTDENLRTYNLDRRSFEWWTEGNWSIADNLFNSAGPGFCINPDCGKHLERVSPDHVGPLACGFKQLPLFVPMCAEHNSSKNRRFTKKDVEMLLEYEDLNGDSVASRQVRAHWDKYKTRVANDNHTKSLSNSLRSLQDMYLRVLFDLLHANGPRFIATLLHPEYALEDYEFIGLNRSTFRFKTIVAKPNKSTLRQRQTGRTVRIALQSLSDYAKKGAEKRALMRFDYRENLDLIGATIEGLEVDHPDDQLWKEVLKRDDPKRLESELLGLLQDGQVPQNDLDVIAMESVCSIFDEIGSKTEIDFSVYDPNWDIE